MSARDRVILVLMPGFAILAIYAIFFGTSRQRLVTKLQTDVDTARALVPSPQTMFARQQAHEYAKKKLDEALAKAMELKGEFEAKIRLCQSGVGRSQRITRLTEVMNAHDLQVLNHVPADGARENRATRLSVAQERLVKQLTEAGGPVPQAWHFELVGKFADLASVLEELGEGELIAVPLAVTMDEVKDVAVYRRWTLLVWI